MPPAKNHQLLCLVLHDRGRVHRTGLRQDRRVAAARLRDRAGVSQSGLRDRAQVARAALRNRRAVAHAKLSQHDVFMRTGLCRGYRVQIAELRRQQ